MKFPIQIIKPLKDIDLCILNLYRNKEATHRENEMMLKKLGRSRIRTSESDKNQALAKLAGIDIPSTSEHLPNKKRQRGREKSRGKVHSFLNQCCVRSSVDSISWSFS